MSIVVAELLMPYLDPSDLYRFCLTSKRLQSVLSRKIALRSILFKGSKSAIIMIEATMELLKEGKIHAPSAMRLLRLAFGKHCEIGNCLAKVVHNGSHLHYGMYCCWDCLRRLTSEYTHIRVRERKKLGPAFDSPRTSMWKGSMTAYMWDRPFHSKSGECIGPLITVQLMAQLGQQVEAKKFVSLQAAFDDYLLNAPEMQQSDDTKNLLEIYDCIAPHAAAYRLKLWKEESSKKRKRVEDKKDKFVRIKQQIKDLVGPLAVDFAWQNTAFYRICILPFEKAPSKATKKAVSDIAEKIRNEFDYIPDGFFELSFLDDQNSIDVNLKRICQTHLHNLKCVAVVCTAMSAMIKCGYLKEAVIYFILRGCFYDLIQAYRSPSAEPLHDFRIAYKQTIPKILRDVFSFPECRNNYLDDIQNGRWKPEVLSHDRISELLETLRFHKVIDL